MSGLMQLEAYAVELRKVVECVESNENPLMQISRIHQHSINSAVLQTAIHLNTEVQRGTRQIKESVTKKINKHIEG